MGPLDPHGPVRGGRGATRPATPLPPRTGEGRGAASRAAQRLGDRGFLRVAIPLAGFNLSGGVKSLVGRGERDGRPRAHRPVPGPRLCRRRRRPRSRPGVRLRVLRSGSGLATIVGAETRCTCVRLSPLATAGADVCLANYFTTAYVALASKWLRRDRAVLAYNVRGYEPLSHGLYADASLPSRVVRAALAWMSYRLPLQKICTTDWLKEQTGDPSAWVVGHGIDLEVFRPDLNGGIHVGR